MASAGAARSSCSVDIANGAAARIASCIDALQRDRSNFEVVAVRRTPPSPGQHGQWPEWVDPRITTAFAARGIDRPYAHQRAALDATHEGRDVVVATSTASGKSLCYQVPIYQAALQDPRARALLLYPTKALARDQLQAMRDMAGAGSPLAGLFGVGPYDGDASPDERSAARVRAHAVASNPDMLHRSLLGDHGRWSRFIAGLRYVVIDEIHMYRGVFGSHVANILRRLWRVCAHHGSHPQVIACSATIANPAEHAAALIGRGRACAWSPGPNAGSNPGSDPGQREFASHAKVQVTVPRSHSPVFAVTRSDAPVGERTFVVVNPPVVDETTGIRRNYIGVTRRATEILGRHGLATLAFCRTRKAVELLTRYLRETESGGVQGKADTRDDGARALAWSRATKRVRGYRGGYLPDRRREVESALRSGEAQIVATTNALELGVDIGGLDAVVIAGYPGTRAAVVQRAGRAGRRGAPALTVMCLSSSPLDQFVAASPAFVLDEAVEHARIDPDNPEIVLPHLRCAAHELPLRSDVAPAGMALPDYHQALAYLVERRVLLAETLPASLASPTSESTSESISEAVDGPLGCVLYHHIGSSSPADGVDIRGDIQENFSVIRGSSRGGHRGQVLAEVDFEDAPLYLHVGAIYSVEGQTHEVSELDWEHRKAYVRVVDADYFTEAVVKVALRAIDDDCAPESEPGDLACGTVWMHLRRQVPGFKKIRFSSHENIGFGPIELPDLELHTAGVYWQVPPRFQAAIIDAQRRAAAALAVGHCLHHVGAMVCMCDPSDLGHAVAAGEPGSWAEVAGAGLGRPGISPALQLAASGDTRIYVYDRAAGGSGLATSLFDRGVEFLGVVAAMMAGCRCPRGCPTCVGAEVWGDAAHDPRGDALALLDCLGAAIPDDQFGPARIVDRAQAYDQAWSRAAPTGDRSAPGSERGR